MRILIADDHPLYREGLCLRLQRKLEGAELLEATTIQEILSHASATPGLDLIVLDYFMPGLGTVAALREVMQAFPGAPVLLMSGAAPHQEIVKAIDAGIRGYVPKTLSSDVMQAAIHIILAGGTYLPTEFIQSTAAPAEEVPAVAGSTLDGLTPREREVLLQVAAGASNKEIGRALNLSEVTVKLHVHQIFRKIGARNRASAAVLVARAGLI